jgi:hypothetical protein
VVRIGAPLLHNRCFDHGFFSCEDAQQIQTRIPQSGHHLGHDQQICLLLWLGLALNSIRAAL